MRHITFVHPFCSLLVAACALTYYVMRLTSDRTIGSDYVLSAVVYVEHQPFCVAMGMAAANNLKLAAALTRTQPGAGGVSRIIRAVERYHVALCFYSLVGWITVWLVPAYPSHQQPLSIAMILLAFFPDVLIGPATVLATRRVTAALIQNLDWLTAAQQQERRTVYRKLRNFSTMIALLVSANAAVLILLAISNSVRQAGLPLYALAWHLSSFFILGVRLLLLKAPRRRAAATATVHPGHAARTGTCHQQVSTAFRHTFAH